MTPEFEARYEPSRRRWFAFCASEPSVVAATWDALAEKLRTRYPSFRVQTQDVGQAYREKHA